MSKSDDIVIFSNPQKGTAPHPALGIGLLSQIDIDTFPGVARLNKLTSNVTDEKTFTVTIASPAVFSRTGHGLYAGVPVKFSTTGALPTGLTVGTTYYVISSGLTADAFQVSTSRGGSAVNTSGSQSGTHSVSSVTGLTYWIVRNPANGDLYSLDSSGQVHKATNEVTWTPLAGQANWGEGQGLAIWKGYLLVARETQMDAVNLSTGTWTASFLDTAMQSVSTAAGYFHTMLTSIDDKLYICNDRYIYLLSELTTFDPTVAAGTNYSENATAITLPSNYHSKCLADLGSNIMVGTLFGSSFSQHKVADIFPYNRSTLTLGIPVKLGENGVHQLITVGNRLYATAGLTAKIFITDGSSSASLGEISNYAIALAETGGRLDLYPGAITYHKGKILFGVDNSVTVNGNVGVWSFNPNNKQLLLENIVSSGSNGSANRVAIGALFSSSQEGYFIGWKDYTTPATEGIDRKSGSSFVTSYTGAIETQFARIGEALNKRTLETLEFFLAKPLSSGEGIRFKYRKDLNSAFTTLATRDFTSYGAIQAGSISAASITKAHFIQLRIELTSTGDTTPELMSVVLKPSN